MNIKDEMRDAAEWLGSATEDLLLSSIQFAIAVQVSNAVSEGKRPAYYENEGSLEEHLDRIYDIASKRVGALVQERHFTLTASEVAHIADVTVKETLVISGDATQEGH